MDIPILALGLCIGTAVTSAIAMLLIFAIDELNHKQKIKELTAHISNI